MSTEEYTIIRQGKAATYHYLSLSESIKQNGDRHKANAEKYLAEGKLQHAAGSLRKAARNYERAAKAEMPQLQYLGLFDMDAFTDKLKVDISNMIMYGTSYSLDGESVSLIDIFK